MPLTAIATVAGSAAIQLNVAKLRLGERKQPAIGICEIIVDKDAFRVGVYCFSDDRARKTWSCADRCTKQTSTPRKTTLSSSSYIDA
jgi:hypothetical protein